MRRNFMLVLSLVSAGLFSSCCRSGGEVWEDTKTCGRYMGKGFRSLRGKHVDSREYASFFDAWEQEQEFVALADHENLGCESSRESPGDPGSPIPGVEGFHSPTGRLATLFRQIAFDTDNYTVKGEENIKTLKEIADYLNKNSSLHVFVEGHADERGPAAYNLALGSKRANSVRNFLVQNGVNPDRLFTISYGIERPAVLGHDELAWQQNRRAQFKMYDR